MTGRQSAHMSCARSESFLQPDRNGTIPLTNNVGAGRRVPRGRGQGLLKAHETNGSEFGQSYANLSCRDIFIKNLVGLTRGDHLAIDHPPLRHPTGSQPQDRLANVECEGCEINQMPHLLHVCRSLRDRRAAIGVSNNDHGTADLFDAPADDGSVVIQALPRRPKSTGAGEFGDVCPPAAGSKCGLYFVPRPAAMPSAGNQ